MKKNEKYWAALFPKLPCDELGLRMPSVYDTHARDFHMGITGCYIRISQRVNPAGICAAIVLKRSAQDYLDLLLEQHASIENELGEKLYWYHGIIGEKQGHLKLKPCDVTDQLDWADQHQWLARKIEDLVDAFRLRIEKQSYMV